MYKLFLTSLVCLHVCFFSLSDATAQSSPGDEKVNRPKIVVGIVVDQMRWDYLYRYYDRYGEGGFKRMLKEGFSCENTYIDYIPTVTAIGHSTVYTGSVPSIHGIAGNNFYIQETGRELYCTEDSIAQTVGSESKAGQMSPRNLLSSTITDELKLATNFRSRVIGVAIKDRGSILPAGHAADAAYWFDGSTGDWITSTYYMESLPQWVQRINKKNLPEKYLKKDWNTLYPIETYAQSTPDDNAYEGKFKGTEAPTLPVNTSALMEDGVGIIRSTPYGNTITIEMAKAAIENEELGKDDITDFLAVSFSSTDYVGHRFGVNAIETEDTYLRLDADLAEFFTFLDNEIGEGNYTVFLTADHAAAHNATFLSDHNIPAGIWPSGELLKELNKTLQRKYGTERIVLSLSNYQVTLNYAQIKAGNLNDEEIRRDCVRFLEKQEGVAWVVDMEKAAVARIPEPIRERIVNGYNRKRSGIVQIVLEPGWYGGSGTTGTTHGTWSPYDAHIPLLWMGWGIRQGKTNQPVHMTDISATLSALLRIQEPSGCVGQPITEVLE